jgi:hypothetical protein
MNIEPQRGFPMNNPQCSEAELGARQHDMDAEPQRGSPY